MGFDPGSTRRASFFQATGFRKYRYSAYEPELLRLYYPPWNHSKPPILFNDRPGRLSPTFQDSLTELSQGRRCSVYQIPWAASCRIHRRARKTGPSYMKARVSAEATDPPLSPHPVSRNSQMSPSRSLSDWRENLTNSNYRRMMSANKLNSEHTAQLSQNQLLDHFGVIDTDKGHLCDYYLGAPDGVVVPGRGDDPPHSADGPKDPTLAWKEGDSRKGPQDVIHLYQNDFWYLLNGCLGYMYPADC
ncbi:hypothetical protein BJX64DRAFT_297015 [Aspergillus heterothallicus]